MLGSETPFAVTGRTQFVGPIPAIQPARQPDVATAHLTPSGHPDTVSAGAFKRTSGVSPAGWWDVALRGTDRDDAPTHG